MATKKISELPAVTVPALTSELEVNEAGTSKKETVAQLLSHAIPASSTDNVVVRRDGTAGKTQDSGVTIDDSNQINTPGGMTAIGGLITGSGSSGVRFGSGNESLMASDFVFSWCAGAWDTARQLNVSKAAPGVLSLDSGTAGDGLGKLKLGGMRFVGYTSSAAGASTTELPNDKDCSIHKNTTTGIKSLAFNDGGSVVSIAMA